MSKRYACTTQLRSIYEYDTVRTEDLDLIEMTHEIHQQLRRWGLGFIYNPDWWDVWALPLIPAQRQPAADGSGNAGDGSAAAGESGSGEGNIS